MDWDSGISRCSLLSIEWLNNKVLLHGTGSYIQYPMINHNGKEREKEYIQCVCITESLCCTPESKTHCEPTICCAKSLQACPTLCEPYGLQPTRILCPWDSTGKNPGVGCHFLLSRDLPSPEIEPASLISLALAGRFFLTSATWKGHKCVYMCVYIHTHIYTHTYTYIQFVRLIFIFIAFVLFICFVDFLILIHICSHPPLL